MPFSQWLDDAASHRPRPAERQITSGSHSDHRSYFGILRTRHRRHAFLIEAPTTPSLILAGSSEQRMDRRTGRLAAGGTCMAVRLTCELYQIYNSESARDFRPANASPLRVCAACSSPMHFGNAARRDGDSKDEVFAGQTHVVKRWVGTELVSSVWKRGLMVDIRWDKDPFVLHMRRCLVSRVC